MKVAPRVKPYEVKSEPQNAECRMSNVECRMSKDGIALLSLFKNGKYTLFDVD